MRVRAELSAGRRGWITGAVVAAAGLVVSGCATGNGARPTSAAQHLAAAQDSAKPAVSASARVTHAAAVKKKNRPAAVARASTAPAYFHTLSPGARLPSDAQCAAWVLARPLAENKRMNRPFNAVKGQRVGGQFFPAADDPRASSLAARIDGNFTGTTAEILRWAACKWGVDQNLVFAQAAVESWWRQTTKGDFNADPAACPPGHGLGVDGQPGLCPQSYGILQNRFPFERQSWPGIYRSTAMNADTAYAIWRACYDGYEGWLNNVDRGQQYQAGDAWGCVGRWFAGRWHTQPAMQYVSKVKSYLSQRIWLQPYFQEG